MERVPIDIWELIASKVDNVCDWRNLTLTCKFLNRLAFGESRKRILRKLTYCSHYYGSTCYYLAGTKIKHREDDMPAMVTNDICAWYQFGVQHRDNDLPAYESDDGYRTWWQHGLRHRDNDLPAVTFGEHEVWYEHGELVKESDGDCPGCPWCSGF